MRSEENSVYLFDTRSGLILGREGDRMSCSVRNLAHYVIDMCTRENHPVSNLQLQKMLYFLQTVYCRATGGSLLFEEKFEAWPYGPVIEAVYREYSEYGGSVIERCYPDDLIYLGISDEWIDFVNDGIRELREKYPWDLVKMSHAPNSPWAQVYKDGEGYRRPIDNELIKAAAIAN